MEPHPRLNLRGMLRQIAGDWRVMGVLLVILNCFLLLKMSGWIPLPWFGFAQDLGIMLDAAWRFSQGQMPHRDYISALGPAYTTFVGSFLALGGNTYESFRLLPGVTFLLLSVVCYFVTVVRLHPLVAFAVSIATGAIAGGTYHLGFSPELLSSAVMFNRLGWAFVIIVAFVCCLPEGDGHRRIRQLRYVVGGFVTGSLLFWKANFFAVALCIFLFGLILPRKRLSDYLALFGGAGFVAALLWLSLIDWRLGEMVRDLGYASAARSGEFISVTLALMPGKLLSNTFALLMVFSLSCILLVLRDWRSSLVVFVTAGCAIVLMASNSCGDGSGDPLLWAGLVVAVAWLASGFCQSVPDRPGLLPHALLAWLVVLCGALAWFIIPQTISYLAWNAVSQKGVSVAGAYHGPGPLRALLLGPSNTWGEHFVPRLEEGSELVRRHCTQNDSLLYLDYCNPFSFITSTRSPKGTMLWYCRISTISPKGHPAADEMFRDVDYVMVPNQPLSADGTSILVQLYEGYLRAHYRLLEATENFILLRRAS